MRSLNVVLFFFFITNVIIAQTLQRAIFMQPCMGGFPNPAVGYQKNASKLKSIPLYVIKQFPESKMEQEYEDAFKKVWKFNEFKFISVNEYELIKKNEDAVFFSLISPSKRLEGDLTMERYIDNIGFAIYTSSKKEWKNDIKFKLINVYQEAESFNILYYEDLYNTMAPLCSFNYDNIPESNQLEKMQFVFDKTSKFFEYELAKIQYNLNFMLENDGAKAYDKHYLNYLSEWDKSEFTILVSNELLRLEEFHKNSDFFVDHASQIKIVDAKKINELIENPSHDVYIICESFAGPIIADSHFSKIVRIKTKKSKKK